MQSCILSDCCRRDFPPQIMFARWLFVVVLVVLLPRTVPAQAQAIAFQKLAIRKWAGPDLSGDTSGVSRGACATGGFSSQPCRRPAGGMTQDRCGSCLRMAARWQESSVGVPAWTAGASWGDTIICAGGLIGEHPSNRGPGGRRQGRPRERERSPAAAPPTRWRGGGSRRQDALCVWRDVAGGPGKQFVGVCLKRPRRSVAARGIIAWAWGERSAQQRRNTASSASLVE